ncbi:hypothetical protein ACFQZ4_22795 [Catellatospora coxensis]|uniref:hypothetical protein n=1 Tax=Catellatospora coxensis TaxID=310354 RepID=UPI0019409D1B|nr:hypothetical protein [Catellatospora coxensis]
MRSILRRSVPLLVVAALAAFGTAACGKGGTPAAAPTAVTSLGPSAAPSSAAPAPSPSPKAEKGFITAGGYGPYVIGLALAKADAGKLVTKKQSTAGCPGWVAGFGSGEYADVAVIFYNGELLWFSTDGKSHQTAAGAQVGAKLAEVKAMYAGAKELPGPNGEKALSVDSGKNTLFFRFSKAGVLTGIEAGDAETLEFRYTEGEGC